MLRIFPIFIIDHGKNPLINAGLLIRFQTEAPKFQAIEVILRNKFQVIPHGFKCRIEQDGLAFEVAQQCDGDTAILALRYSGQLSTLFIIQCEVKPLIRFVEGRDAV